MRTVREMFKSENKELLTDCVHYFAQQMDELAALRRFRVIADVMNEIEQGFEDSRREHGALAELLADRLDLHPKLIMDLLHHQGDLTPQARIALAKNLVAQDDYDSATLGEYFEDHWVGANEQAAILILEGILQKPRGRSVMSWGVTSLLVNSWKYDLLKLQKWLLDHEDQLISQDQEHALGGGMFLAEAFEVQKLGLKKLARHILPNAMDHVLDYDLIFFSEIMLRQPTLSEAIKAGEDPTVKFILSCDTDCRDLLESVKTMGFEKLSKTVKNWPRVDYPIVHDRLRSILTVLQDNAPWEFTAHWKTVRTDLAQQSLKIDRGTLRTLYSNIADIERVSLLDLCTVYQWAKTDRVALNPVLEGQHFSEQLKKNAVAMSADETLICAKARQKGLELPDWFFRKIVRERYPKWNKAQQQQLLENAPPFLLELCEVLQSEKLSHDLGL